MASVRTDAELIEELRAALVSIGRMHEFGLSREYGSPSHRGYHDGMARCARYCVKRIDAWPNDYQEPIHPFKLLASCDGIEPEQPLISGRHFMIGISIAGLITFILGIVTGIFGCAR